MIAVVRHYIGDLIYGANDGLITTFAVVAAASGGALTARTVLIVGMANLLADGLSMGVGNYLSIRSREGALAAVGRAEEEAFPARHGTATFMAFVLAGTVPLLPYALGASISVGLSTSVLLTFATLFGVGASRASHASCAKATAIACGPMRWVGSCCAARSRRGACTWQRR